MNLGSGFIVVVTGVLSAFSLLGGDVSEEFFFLIGDFSTVIDVFARDRPLVFGVSNTGLSVSEFVVVIVEAEDNTFESEVLVLIVTLGVGLLLLDEMLVAGVGAGVGVTFAKATVVLGVFVVGLVVALLFEVTLKMTGVVGWSAEIFFFLVRTDGVGVIILVVLPT